MWWHRREQDPYSGPARDYFQRADAHGARFTVEQKQAIDRFLTTLEPVLDRVIRLNPLIGAARLVPLVVRDGSTVDIASELPRTALTGPYGLQATTGLATGLMDEPAQVWLYGDKTASTRSETGELIVSGEPLLGYCVAHDLTEVEHLLVVTGLNQLWIDLRG